jgi:hypothetical protein
MSSVPTATSASALEKVKQKFEIRCKTRTGRECIPASL